MSLSRRIGAWLVPGLCWAMVAAAREPLVVSPGQLVVWRGEEVESCAVGSERWAAREGDCWYPIDLLQTEGILELSRTRAGGVERVAVRVGPYSYPVQRITIADDSKVNLSPRDLARVEREQRRVSALWALRSPPRFTLPLGPPLERLPEGGRFGSRRFFNDQPRSPHSGADYGAAEGTPVLAVARGRVALAADLFFSGNSVFVDHGDGLVSMYFHFSRILVGEGEAVERGQTIGEVGQTGRATGPHLHFGVRWRGARVDPALLLGPTSAVPAIP